MRRALALLLPPFGVAVSVGLLVWAISQQMAGEDATRTFGLGIVAWIGGIAGGLWLGAPRRA